MNTVEHKNICMALPEESVIVWTHLLHFNAPICFLKCLFMHFSHFVSSQFRLTFIRNMFQIVAQSFKVYQLIFLK